MTESTDNSKTAANGTTWAASFTTWPNLIRFCFGFFFVAFILAAATLVIFRNMPSDVRVETTEKGAIIYYKAQKPEAAILMLPAMVEWSDTGIDLHNDQSVYVTATGRVNLAVHRAVEAAQQGERPRRTWVDPDGKMTFPNRLDESRRLLLIAPRQPYGAVLAYVRSPGGADPDPKTNPRPDGIVKIGSGAEVRGEGRLWLTINDAMIGNDPKLRLAYAGGGNQDVLTEAYGRNAPTVTQEYATWDNFIKAEYWDGLFADNAGEFLIQVDFSGKHHKR